MKERESKGSLSGESVLMKMYDRAMKAVDVLGVQGHERKSLLRTYEAGLRLTHLETEGRTMDPKERDALLKNTILKMRSNLEGIRERVSMGRHDDEIADAKDLLKEAMKELRRAPGAQMVYSQNRALAKANLANIIMLGLNLQDKDEEFWRLTKLGGPPALPGRR